MAEDNMICARCGAAMTCTPEGDCWCMALPFKLPMPEAPAGCYCRRCLEAVAAIRPAS
jgi:hypothetical protein